jgi:hypothetical protein
LSKGSTSNSRPGGTGLGTVLEGAVGVSADGVELCAMSPQGEKAAKKSTRVRAEKFPRLRFTGDFSEVRLPLTKSHQGIRA